MSDAQHKNGKNLAALTSSRALTQSNRGMQALDNPVINLVSPQEYVSCPSCGRTLFDLQEISAEIREKTSHLPGVSVCTSNILLWALGPLK